MDKQEIIRYWIKTSNLDHQTMHHLFQTEDYHWALFIGHLVLEKLLKAIYVKKYDDNPPRIHDLARLAQRSDLTPDTNILDKLDTISRFNISVRYPDYQREFYKICTKSFAQSAIESIEEIRSWLLNVIHKS